MNDENTKYLKKEKKNCQNPPLPRLEKYGIMCLSRWIMPTPQNRYGSLKIKEEIPVWRTV